MFVFVTKQEFQFFFSLPNKIIRAEKPDLYVTRATLEYLQLIILTTTTTVFQRHFYNFLKIKSEETGKKMKIEIIIYSSMSLAENS